MKPGDHLGSFELLRSLGEGPFGVVWLASDKNGTPAAVKVLKPAFVKRHAGQAAFNRLLASIRTHQQLRHEGLVGVYGPIEDPEQGALGMVTEYVEGRQMSRVRLPERARHGHDPRALATLLRWFEDLADTMAWLHAHDVVHGNLKPTNLMLVRRVEGHQLKILDLPWSAIGLAAPPPGQITYLAPEQVQGGAPTHASDQWSLAMLLYRILTAGDEQAGLAGFPTSLVVALQRASRTAPRERFGDVAQLGAALRATRQEVEGQLPQGVEGGTPLPMVGTPLPVAAASPGPADVPPPTFAPQPGAGYPGYPQPAQAYPGYPQPAQAYPGYPQQPGYPGVPTGYPAPAYPQQPGAYPPGYPGYPQGYAAPPAPPARVESIPPVPSARRMVPDVDTDANARAPAPTAAGADSQELPLMRHRVDPVAHDDLASDRLEAAVPEDPSLGLEHAGVAARAEPELGETPELPAESGPFAAPTPASRPRWVIPLILVVMFAVGAAAAALSGVLDRPVGGPAPDEGTRPPNPKLDQPVQPEPLAPVVVPPSAVSPRPPPEPAALEPAALEPESKPEAPEAKAAKPEPAKPEPAKPEPASPEPAKPAEAARVGRVRPRAAPKEDALDKAMQRLDVADQQAHEESVACDEGTGSACLAVGKRAQERGDNGAAKAAFGRACEFGQVEGCYRAGRLAAASSPREAILLHGAACDGDHGAACEAVAELLERAGKKTEAAARRRKACELGRKSACEAAPAPATATSTGS